jgi:hypothetical protein
VVGGGGGGGGDLPSLWRLSASCASLSRDMINYVI